MDNGAAATRDMLVVAGIDGSRSYAKTVDLGVAEATRRRARLLIVHVWPGRYAGPFRTHDVVPTPADGRRLLAAATQYARRTTPDIEIDAELAEGSAASVLVRYSETARLMVIGHRDGTLTQPSWGSTATYLAHHGACPLLVHRGAGPREGPVVVAVSARGGPTATLASAYEEAALGGDRLVAVHVWTPAADGAGPRAAVEAGWTTDRQEAERYLAEALAGWTWSFPDVAVDRLILRETDAAYTLDRASRRGTLLVAGAGTHGRFAELLYGSLEPASTRSPACPVLLVPADWSHPLCGEGSAAVGRSPSRPR